MTGRCRAEQWPCPEFGVVPTSLQGQALGILHGSAQDSAGTARFS